MKEKHLTKVNFLTKTNYLNHYSLNLLIGSLFLTLPILSVILLLVLWENCGFLWAAPLFGILGWVLVIPSTYIIARPSKERIAVDILSMGFMAMLFLCVVLIPLKQASLTHPLGAQSSRIREKTSDLYHSHEREETYLDSESIRFLREEIKREEQK